MVVKTFRGLLADDGQDRIRLSTTKGKVGYRIIKFEIISYNPQATSSESVLKIYKTEQPTPDGLIDFSDSDLLGVGVFKNYLGVDYSMNNQIVFDTEIFNQDIYVTHTEEAGTAQPCNYYLELEVIDLSSQAAEYTTLKDIRSRAST